MGEDSESLNEVEKIWRSIRARHPSLRRAIAADAAAFARYRGERHEFRSRLELARYAIRLAWTSDAFLALALYRLKAMLQRRRVRILPALAHRLAMALGQVSIGDPVVVEGGIYLPHGQVVVDGIVEIGAGTVLAPFVTIGLVAGNFDGPVLERDVQVGTGAKILGPVRVGAGATIGAGAVVVDDVPAGATVGGVPARQLRSGSDPAKQNGELPRIEELQEEIRALTQADPAPVSAERAQRLLYVRHLAGIHVLRGANGADFAQPNGTPNEADGLPEFSPADLTPGLLRAGILRDGCVLVRELIPREAALAFAADIERAYQERDRQESGEHHDPNFYSPFSPAPPFRALEERPWIRMAGGLLAVDSPRLSFEMMRLFEQAGLPELVSGYLGEPALVSAQKSTMRKAEPSVAGAWHQDGSFMGEVRSLNLWVSLSRCGDEAPGLDIVPRRVDHLLPSGHIVAFTIAPEDVQEAAGEASIIRPIFAPGDALFFDELFLHQTASDPSMPKPRFAIENWFFGASGFPADYAPIAV